MFLILILLAIVLLFVLLVKRPVNTAGIHVMPDVPIDPPAKAAQPAPVVAQASEPVAPVAPATVDTMNFNDIFGGKPSSKSDRPNV